MVSLGSGDYELVTIKALKALKESEVIFVPTKSEGSFKRSLTYKIVSKLFEEFGFEKRLIPLYSPMKFKVQDWKRQSQEIVKAFESYEKVSFVTLGDAGIYSSVYYLLDFIKELDSSIFENTTVIPGVTSFSDASARIKKPLCVGDSSLEIIPLLEKEVPKTRVYMRPKVGMSSEKIENLGEIYTFENLNFQNEKITPAKIEKVEKYMTLFVDFYDKKRD